MLLSRVAEALCWAGRYLERVETTARVVCSHTELYLDLPKASGLTWEPLLAVNDSIDLFDERYADRSEEHVVAFLVTDEANPGSLLNSLAAARENMRTTRAVFPRGAWELLNDVYLRAAADASDAIGRRNRLPWLHEMIGDCQQLTGLLAGSMTDDEAYAFFRIGRHLERADMTTRVLGVRAGMLGDGPPTISPFADVLWLAVLKAVGAEHAYRRQGSPRVKGADVLRFLLQDPGFPRSVDHCLGIVAGEVRQLPSPEPVVAACLTAQFLVDDARVKALAWDGLTEYVDEVQQAIHEVHQELDATYFRRSSDGPDVDLESKSASGIEASAPNTHRPSVRRQGSAAVISA